MGETGRRIVVIEDNPDVSDLLQSLLRSAGHEVVSTTESKGAVSGTLFWQPKPGGDEQKSKGAEWARHDQSPCKPIPCHVWAWRDSHYFASISYT